MDKRTADLVREAAEGFGLSESTVANVLVPAHLRSAYKPRQVVAVYEDPYTRERLEGHATLVSLLSVDDGTERWRVRFKGDDRNVIRTLVPED